MNLLDGLQNLLGGKKPVAKKGASRVARPITGVNGLNILLNGHPEDAGFVNGPQLPVRLNADVAHFPMQPQGAPEDAGLVNGPQGPGPVNADIAHFNGPAIGPTWQQRRMQSGIQGGAYRPSALPLQNSNIRYRQGLQPTNPWYDF